MRLKWQGEIEAMVEKEVAGKSPLEVIGYITEFNDMSTVLQDEQIDMALAQIITILGKYDSMSRDKCTDKVVQLQSMSAIFQVKAMYYTYLEAGKAGSVQYQKKQAYYTMSAALDKLVDALKYGSKKGI